ncbi:hypothetical protein QUF58_14730 [Anaerolineales bacterium HSG24]|nr:hypothetical protein [Anaerolineales bacterium HSG24]
MLTTVVVGVATFLGLRVYRTRQRKQKWSNLLEAGKETIKTETGTYLSLVEPEPSISRDVALTVLTVGTGLVHLQMGLVAGAGFIGVLGLYYLPQAKGYRDLTRDALMTYSGATLVVYLGVNGLRGGLAGLGITVAQLSIIGLLNADTPQLELLSKKDDKVVTVEASPEPASAEPTPEVAAAAA